MDSIGQRLYNLRRKVGLNTKQMSELTNVSVSAIEAYEANYTSPNVKFLTRVAEIFGISPAFVAGLTENPKTHENSGVCEVYVVNNLGDAGIPRLNDVVGTAFMSRIEMHGGEYYAFVAQDDSMIRARIQKNDVLIVRIQNYANNNDIVVAICEDEQPIVRRYNREGNMVTLTSETPKPGFDAIKIDTKETKLIISGVVQEIRMNLK